MTQQRKDEPLKRFQELQNPQGRSQSGQPQGVPGGGAPPQRPSKPVATGGQSSGSGPRPGGQQQQSRLPVGYMQKGILDPASGEPWPEVICDWPRDIAKCLSEGQNRMSMAQIRRFHGDVLRIKQKLEATKDFATAATEVRTLCQFANDAVKKRKAPREFEEFIRKNVDEACKSSQHFTRGFVVHLQGVVAYFPQDSRR